MRYTTHKHPTDKHKFLILDHNTETAEEVILPGHMVYIRLTERAEQLGGIYIPERSRDEHTTLYEVIAIGERTQAYRPRERRFKGVLDMDRNSHIDIDVGDTILIPEKATADSSGYCNFVKRSDISQYEGYIDKGLILAKVS